MVTPAGAQSPTIGAAAGESAITAVPSGKTDPDDGEERFAPGALSREADSGESSLLTSFAPWDLNHSIIDDLFKTPWSSVSLLQRQIDILEAQGDDPDFLEAYYYFLQQRAFPFDEVDWSAYDRAAVQRDRMAAAQIGRRLGAVPPPSPPPPTARWANVGPQDLDVPSRRYFGFRPISGRVTCVAFDAQDVGVYYLGGADGGVWKSTNFGLSWKPLSDKSPVWKSLQVSSIAVDPYDGDIVYAGTGDFRGFFQMYGFGLMKSTDGGATWVNKGAATFGNVALSKILIDPHDPSILIVTTGGRSNFNPVPGRVYRSTDGGDNFAAVAGPPNAVWCGAARSTDNAMTQHSYYVAGYVFPGAPQVWRSDDYGDTWTNVTPPALAALAVTAANVGQTSMYVAASPIFPDYVYVMCGLNQRIYRSDNKGDNRPDGSSSWQVISGNYNALNNPAAGLQIWGQSGYNYYLECSNRVIRGVAEDVLYVGGITLAASPDYGTTWLDIGLTTTYTGPTPITNANYAPNMSNAVTHSDQQCLAINPSDPNEVLCGNDGGVYRIEYTPRAVTQATDWVFDPLNATLRVTQFYASAFHPTTANIILGGAQDNAGPYSNNNLNSWDNVGIGDGGFCAINPTNTNIQYLTGPYLFTFRTGNNWANRLYPMNANTTIITPPGAGQGNTLFIAPLVMDPNNSNFIYAGSRMLRRRNDATGTWTAPLGAGGGQVLDNGAGFVSAIAIAPGRGQRVYTGSSDGAIWMTDNALNAAPTTVTFTRINAPVTRFVKSIAVDPNNPNRIFVGFSGMDPAANTTSSIWRCNDTTAVPPVWVNISGVDMAGRPATRLPNIPLNAIALDPDDSTRAVYVGTDVGVFYTQTADLAPPAAGGLPDVQWTNATQPLGLPNVMVFDLKAVPGTGFLNAATFGRGMWRIPINLVKLAQIKVRNDLIKVGRTTSLTVILNMAAPLGGAVVPLRSSNPAVISVPPTITVNAFKTAKTITVQGSGVGQTTLTATYGGVSMSVNVTVTP